MASEESKLNERELELLKTALPFAKDVAQTEGRVVTQDELRDKLGCRSIIARNIHRYIISSNALKVADRLEALPERAEIRAEVGYALGNPSGNINSFVLRENSALKRQVLKQKFTTTSQKELRNIEIRAEIEELKKQAKEEIVRKPFVPKPVKKTGLMLEVSLFDVHFGKLAWPSETGGVPYDLKIAETMFMRALDKLIERASVYQYEEILFPVGNDLLHTNDTDNKTVHGTIVDAEGRFQKTYWTVRKTVVEAIEKLKNLGPVRVIACYGNHDKTAAWTLTDSVECWFHNDPSVTVDNAPTYRKYHEWGNVGLMFTHGDLGKREDFPLLFATERPELFGRTKFREIHTGHNHSTKNQEFHGVRVRTLGALTPADEWHASQGYIGSLRVAESFVWSKDEGLIAQFTYCDDAFPAIKTKRELKETQ